MPLLLIVAISGKPLWDGFLEKAQSGLLIAVDGEQEVDGLNRLV